MPGKVLTAKGVQKLMPRPGRDRDIYFDRTKGAPEGFAVRVTAEGARRFWLLYRFEGAKCWLNLGDADALSLSDARDKARTARTMLRKGLDPREEERREKLEREAEEKRKQEQETASAGRPTLAALVGRFIKAHAKHYTPKTIAEYRRILRAYVEPEALGGLLAADIRRYQIREWLERLVSERGPIMANRVQQLVRASLSWGIVEGLDEALEANPAAGFDIHDERPLPKEKRVLSDDDTRKLWRGLDATDKNGKRAVFIEAAAYVKLLLLCGLRRTEAARADWQNVNLKAGEWLIPSGDRKAAGRRGKGAIRRELIVPLSSGAKAELVELQEVTGGRGPVFGEASATVLANPHRFVERIRKATGVTFSLHTLRATAATGAGEAGAAPFVVSLILGHATLPGAADATPLYNRAQYLTPVRDGLEKWARRLRLIVSDERKPATVAPFRGRQ